MSRIVKFWHTNLEETAITIGNIPEPLLYELPEDSEEDALPEEPAIDLELIKREAEHIKKMAAEEAQAHYDDIIQKAKNQAEKIKQDAIAHANNQAIDIKEKAQNDGYETGINSAKDEADQIVAQAEEIKAQAHIFREELIQEIEPEMIELVISILDSLIEVEKDINPEAISILIKNGLGKTSAIQDVAVHTSPEDYPSIDKAMILSSTQSMTDVQFVEDPTLKKLDCIIKTPLGSIDCGLDTQYKSLRKNLHYVLKNR
ncbi:MAG: FliH/SctL family protein [Defluviitaleaceae bacterium]|nr:FliH/SctL family protein [Defluviitaleaceae bacterium]